MIRPARAAYAEVEQEFAAIVAMARREATQAYDRPDDALVRYLADIYIHEHLESDEAMRWRREPQPTRYVTSEAALLDVYSECREVARGLRCRRPRRLLGRLGLPVRPGHRFLPQSEGQGLAEPLSSAREAACTVWGAIDKRIDWRLSASTPLQSPERPRRRRKER